MIIAVVVIVVVLVVVASVLYFLVLAANVTHPTVGDVDITEVYVDPTACWDDTSSAGGVFNEQVDFTDTVTLTNPSDGPASCQVYAVDIVTDGFTIVSDNAPVTVDAGTTQTLTVVLQTPDYAYTGTMTLELYVSES